MNKAIIGRKLGMTQVFTQDGTVIPVTAIEAGPCPVVQVKTKEKDGYSAVQLGFGKVKLSRLNKPLIGHQKKAKPENFVRTLKEFKLDGSEGYQVGTQIKCDIFSEGDAVDVSGISKGHGYSGVIKRWNQSRLMMSHGAGPVARHPGSMGANSTPSRVMPGKKLPGHWGVEKVTILNLKVVKVYPDRNVLLVKGGVPGPKDGIVFIKSAVKGAENQG